MLVLLLCGLALLHGARADRFCEGLGWFRPDGPFEGWPDPNCPGDPGMDLTFTMYSGPYTGPGETGDLFDQNNLPPNFDGSIKTAFVTHGFMDSTENPWMGDLKDALRELSPINVVLVNWSGPNGSSSDPPVAASTTRTVGARHAQVMMNLVANGSSSLDLIHYIGHSLGSHISGHSGRWSRDRGYQAGRISGMDPSGPIFSDSEDRNIGIYRDCADFVDIIHTDRVLGSTPEPGGPRRELGHVDFYPNDGTFQPGCNMSATCDHARVVYLYTSSIRNDCFPAIERCGSSNDLNGTCASCEPTCPQMGYFASPADVEGLYRLYTTAEDPFCLPEDPERNNHDNK